MHMDVYIMHVRMLVVSVCMGTYVICISIKDLYMKFLHFIIYVNILYECMCMGIYVHVHILCICICTVYMCVCVYIYVCINLILLILIVLLFLYEN